MRHDPEMSPFLRRAHRLRAGGEVDAVAGGLWSRPPGHLSRWGLRDAALIQLCLAALTWAFVAWIIRWSLDW